MKNVHKKHLREKKLAYLLICIFALLFVCVFVLLVLLLGCVFVLFALQNLFVKKEKKV